MCTDFYGRLSVAGLRSVVPGVSNKKNVGAKDFSLSKKEKEMNKTKTVATLAATAVMGVAGAAYAVPEVSNVTMTQRVNSRIVDIGYTLAGEEAIVTLSIETNGVALPDSAVTQLSGDVATVVQMGSRSIVWNAGADWPEHSVTDARARVTAWQTNSPPQCCVVDLAGGIVADTYPVTYYVSVNALPGGVTNDLYKTTRLVMRKIPATGVQGFKMGSPSSEAYRDSNREDWHDVELTKDYYVGVYEVTQSQWQQVMSDVRSWPAKWSNADYKLMRPVEQVSYDDIRGSSAGAGWPANDNVDVDSFIGRLRTKAGSAGFDLPTDAQWEYACRAGTSGALNDGTMNLTNSNSDARMDLLGRYQFDGGKIWSGTSWSDPATDCTTANATAAVGSYLSNAWGLYDMHGNVWEWCLDWYSEKLGVDAVTDPVGAEVGSGSNRVLRGGSWDSTASNGRSAYRHRDCPPPSLRYYSIGFRLVRTLP